MSEQLCEIAVIGAGPAGSHCARLLAEAGRHVVTLEATSLKQSKVCGGLLNVRAWEMLNNNLPEHILVVPEEPDLEYHDLDNRIRARYNPGYHNIDRAAFDAWLLGLAQAAGAEVRLDHRVTGIQPISNGITLSHSQGTLTAKHVIDASGYASVSRRLLGGPGIRRLDCLQGLVRLTPPPGPMWAMYRSAYTPFFGWIIPKGRGHFLLGAGLPKTPPAPELQQPSRLEKNGKDTAVARTHTPELTGAWPKLTPLIEYLGWRGHQVTLLEPTPRAMPLTWLKHGAEIHWGAGNLYAIGEAAGLVSPFSGEGISFALLSAERAAEAILNSNRQGYPLLLGELMDDVVRLLNLACLRSRIGATAFWRPMGLLALPLVTRRKLSYLPWRQESK